MPSSHPRPGYLVDEIDRGIGVAVRGETVQIAVSADESAAVRRAAADLARDLAAVTGAHVTVTADPAAARIVVGTLGQSELVDAAVAASSIDVAALRDESGVLRWEGFLVTLADDVLYLVGADRRGTIYSIYDFTEAIGVSPWYWWGQVPLRARDHVTVATGTHVVDWPSVQYRGVFLNDEEELFDWARAHTADDTIGPEAYERVYELILRLKGNYLWPAMHVGAFNHDPENGRLAHEMGIVVGTSHCDMLLRSNEHEFRPWVQQQEEPVEYDYSLTGRNRDKLREYWQGSVTQNRDYEVTWTVGMRGVHDVGFSTAAIDNDTTLDEEQKFRARVELLETVITDQRELLSTTLGVPADTPPQLFIPYKEVLPLYDAGLHVPDDVTVVWANDNFGYIRRFPSAAERGRPGGHGLYYHSSYWSNLVTSYLATSSTPLVLMKTELRKAWDRGIRKLWVDNIGGLKPLEIEMEFFLRSAWEAGKEDRTADVQTFTADWVDATFTGGHGGAGGEIYTTYYQLNNQRKIEHLTGDVFPQVGYGDEAFDRVEQFRELYDRTNEILEALPAVERDAFFQLFAVKIHFAYLSNAQFAYADRSRLAHAQGKYAAADEYLAVSREFDRHKRALIHFYNHTMSDGVWDGMFTPEQFPPPVMPLHPAATPALALAGRGLGVVVWGARTSNAEQTLTFWPHGTAEKWLEVFSTGAAEVRYQIQADAWIDIAHLEGTVRTEKRLAVRVSDAAARAGSTGTIRISSPDTGDTITVTVAVPETPAVQPQFTGAVEADGYISLDPSRADRFVDGSITRWTVVPFLGRYANAAVQARDSGAADSDWSRDAILEHRFHLHTAGTHVLELHRLPTLNATGALRVGVSVDDAAPVVVSSAITDEHRGTWEEGVQDNVERLRVRLPHLDHGAHTLRLHVIDPDVTLSKLVIYTTLESASNLGPQFSLHTGRADAPAAAPRPEDTGLEAVSHITAAYYRTDPDDVAPLPQVYAGAGFWRGETTFRRTVAVEQLALGRPKYQAHPDGTKDVVAQLGSGVSQEREGRLAIEAEYVLAEDAHAWTTPGDDPADPGWTHTNAETDGHTGLAMHVAPRRLQWADPATAPGMHYTVDVTAPGRYHVWMLVKFENSTDDACMVALDGVALDRAQYNGKRGGMATYGSRQIWVWAQVCDLDVTAGRHTLSVLAQKSGLRIDRLYLTLGDELPPVDADWVPSPREITATTDVTESSAEPAAAR